MSTPDPVVQSPPSEHGLNLAHWTFHPKSAARVETLNPFHTPAPVKSSSLVDRLAEIDRKLYPAARAGSASRISPVPSPMPTPPLSITPPPRNTTISYAPTAYAPTTYNPGPTPYQPTPFHWKPIIFPYGEDVFKNFTQCSLKNYLVHETLLYQRIEFHAKVRLGYSKAIWVLQRELERFQAHQDVIFPYRIDQPEDLPPLRTLLSNPAARSYSETLRMLVDAIGLQKAASILENAKSPEFPECRYQIQAQLPHSSNPLDLETTPERPKSPKAVPISHRRSSLASSLFSPYSLDCPLDMNDDVHRISTQSRYGSIPAYSTQMNVGRPVPGKPGRGGKLQCDECRKAKRGWECVVDPMDGSRRCTQCLKRGLLCSPRTWGSEKEKRRQAAIENRRALIGMSTDLDQPSLHSEMPIRNIDGVASQNLTAEQAEPMAAGLNILTTQGTGTTARGASQHEQTSFCEHCTSTITESGLATIASEVARTISDKFPSFSETTIDSTVNVLAESFSNQANADPDSNSPSASDMAALEELFFLK